MSLRQFTGMLEEIEEIIKMEIGEDERPVSLTGDEAFAVAKRIFKKG